MQYSEDVADNYFDSYYEVQLLAYYGIMVLT